MCDIKSSPQSFFSSLLLAKKRKIVPRCHVKAIIYLPLNKKGSNEVLDTFVCCFGEHDKTTSGIQSTD